MKTSCVLLLVALAAVAFVASGVNASSSEDVTEWVQPSFVEMMTETEATPSKPLAAQKCGQGLTGVCTAQKTWCKNGIPVSNVCAGALFCCVPNVLPHPPTPADNTKVVADVHPGNPLGVDPVGDLSPAEVATDFGLEEVPLSSTSTAELGKLDTQVRPALGPSVPRLEYQALPLDSRVMMNGVLQPLVSSAPAPARAPVVGASAAATNNGQCGMYTNSPVASVAGNGGVVFQVVKILREHLTDPSIFGMSSSARDNSMRTSTACAFERMRVAAAKSGISLKISSGFRTFARQQYFWNCYQTKKCNSGHKAARPGSSNHGRGIALDLNAATPGVYSWLAKNAVTYGFVRTVPTEKWHWENRPGTPKAKYT